MHTTSRFAAVIGLLVICLATPGTTLAGTEPDPNQNDTVLGTVGAVRYARDTGSYDPGSGFGVTVAGCGGTLWHLIGGGGASGGSATASWLAVLQTIDYVDPDTQRDDGMEAAGFGPDGHAITAYSICIKDGDLAYPAKSIPNQPTGLRTGSVTCGPPKWHVTSGGVFIATVNSWMSASFPVDGSDAGTTPDDGWRGTVYDTVGGAGGFDIYAVCAAGLKLHYVRGASGSVASGHARTRKAMCASSEHVVGGGARVSGPADRSRLVTSAPVDGSDADKIPDDGWTTSVYNVSGAAKQVTPFAICLG